MGGDMREDQLKLLEERINTAISFIETLKSREKKLLQEKEELETKVNSFDEIIAEKDAKIEELKGSQGFLREKIETILEKLESFASIDTDSQFDFKTLPETEESVSSEPEKDEEGVLIEDEFVDLKTENVEDESEETEQEEKQEKTNEETLEEKPDTENQDDLDSDEDNQVSEKSDDEEDVIEGIVNEDIFEVEANDETSDEDENILKNEIPEKESEILEISSEDNREKKETSSVDSLTADTTLEKDDNLLFTAESENSTGSLFKNDSLNKLSKIKESSGGSYSKRWIDNNPFIQT
jgi:hypothetical protein